MNPYPTYKDSGVEWLGEVPEHWELKRLKFAAAINPSKSELAGLPGTLEVSFYPMEAIGFGYLNGGEEKTLETVGNGFTYFRNDDVLVAKITPSFENGKGALATGLKNGVGFGTTEIHVIRPQKNLNKYFLYYLTYSHPFRKVGEGMMEGTAGQKRVPSDFLIDYPLALPPSAEQTAIVAYLDRKTAQIDALIEQKRRLIELLQEECTAVISQAVTKGLNPAVPMKDSGIEWIGEVPVHWGLQALWTVSLLQRGHDLTNAERQPGTIPVYSSSGFSGFHNSAMAKGPGVVTGRYGTIGKVFYVEEDYWPMNTSLYVRDFRDNFPRFIYYLLKILPYAAFSDKSAVPGIDRNDLHRLKVGLPPKNEQIVIANFLDNQLSRIDKITAKIEWQIELLQEYRTALISVAVTGKIDVREAVSESQS